MMEGDCSAGLTRAAEEQNNTSAQTKRAQVRGAGINTLSVANTVDALKLCRPG